MHTNQRNSTLAQQGITVPTPAELQAALLGGMTTTSGTVQLAGVLQMRAQGEGWGQIANAFGFKLGTVVRAARAGHEERAEHEERGERLAARAERPEKLERPERVERPERPEIPAHPERPERPERPEH